MIPYTTGSPPKHTITCFHEVVKFFILNARARFTCERCGNLLSAIEVEKRKLKTQTIVDPAIFFSLAPAQRRVLMAAGDGRAVWRNRQTKILNHLTGVPSPVVHYRATEALVDKGMIRLNGLMWELTEIGRFLWGRHR